MALLVLPKAALLFCSNLACSDRPRPTPMWKCSTSKLLSAASCRHVKMALLLLEERRQGRDSPVWGYVEHLPRHFDTLLHWSEAELHELCYPALQQSVSAHTAVLTHQVPLS